MSEVPRITRPRLEVDRARRQPSGLFASARAPGSGEAEHPADAGARGTPRSADAISRGVELGYRVIEEYVRQGSSLARTMSAGALDPDTAQGDVRELGDRMFRYASEAMSIWLELLGMTAGRSAPPPAPDARPPGLETRQQASTPRAGEVHSVAPPSPAAGLAVALDSVRPVEVVVRLHDPSASHPLRVHDLRAEPGEPRLSDVRIDADQTGRPQRVCIRVADSLPAGTYNGLIVDEATGRPAGTLSVTVLRERGL